MMSRILGFLLLVLVGLLGSCSLLNEETRIHQWRTAGDAALARGNYAEAEKHYKAAVDLAQRDGTENSNYLFAAGDLARLYSAQKRDAEAESLFRQRLSIAEKIWTGEPKSLIFVYDDLATFYLLRGRYDDGRPSYLKSLELRAKTFGPDSAEVAQGLDLYAALLKATQHEQEGIDLDARAKAIRAKNTP